MENNDKKQMTLDDLAVMVGNGFSDLGGRMDNLDGRMDGLEQDMGVLKEEVSGLKSEVSGLTKEVSGLRSSVNNYLELSDKRYFELKHRDALIARWVKAVADKTGVPIDLGQLEKIN